MNNNLSDISVDSSTSTIDSSKRHDNIHVINHRSEKVLIPITQDILSQNDEPAQCCPSDDSVPYVIDNLPKKASTQSSEITNDHRITPTTDYIDGSNAGSVCGTSVLFSREKNFYHPSNPKNLSHDIPYHQQHKHTQKNSNSKRFIEI